MIRQYLFNTNKSATLFILKKMKDSNTFVFYEVAVIRFFIFLETVAVICESRSLDSWRASVDVSHGARRAKEAQD
jgi:hypothetical protein